MNRGGLAFLVSAGLATAPLAAQERLVSIPEPDTTADVETILDAESYRQFVKFPGEGHVEVTYCKDSVGNPSAPAVLVAAGYPTMGFVIYRAQRDSSQPDLWFVKDSLPDTAIDAKPADNGYALVHDVLKTNAWVDAFCTGIRNGKLAGR